MVQTKSAKDRSSVERYILKQEIARLEAKRSYNMSTSLISLYIPPGTRLSDIAAQLRDEYGTASNIKDKNTGKAVQAAISSILSRMKNIPHVPETGIAIFCGMTQPNKVEYHLIYPPDTITIKLYVCDYRFHVEHLKEMLESKNRYGLVVVARGGATIAYVQGSKLQIIRDEDSFVPSKHKMGGQSQRRFQRLADEAAAAWYNKVAEMINKIFLEEYPVEAIVIGGPALSKGEFLESKALDYRIKEKIIGLFDVGYTGRAGIRELLDRAKNELSDFELVKERNLMQRFMQHLGKDTGLAIYGEKQVFDALDKSAVDVVLVSEAVDRTNMEIVCDACGHRINESVKASEYNDFIRKLSDRPCPKCGETKLYIDSETDLVEELNALAEKTGATLEIISINHEDGAMLYNVFGGIAAILRYRLYD